MLNEKANRKQHAEEYGRQTRTQPNMICHHFRSLALLRARCGAGCFVVVAFYALEHIKDFW